MRTFCEYFGRYTGAQRGTCTKLPDYILVRPDDERVPVCKPPIAVCTHHAMVIVSRYPQLGRIHERFDLISQLTPAIAAR